MDIEDNIKRFLASIDHVEELDGKIVIPDGIQIADYAFFNRQTIVELKTLKSDPEEKVLIKAQEIIEDDSFPLLWGKFDINTAISKMPGSSKYERQLFLLASRQLEKVLSGANKQIKSTNEYLLLPESTTGMLLIANDIVKTIPTIEIANRFSELLSHKKPDGRPRFESIDTICIMQDVYRISNPNIKKLTPVIVLENDFNSNKKHKSIELALSKFIENWSDFNGFNYIDDLEHVGIKDINKEEFELDSRFISLPKNKQEIIEHVYRNDRYLINLNEEQMINYGKNIINKLINNIHGHSLDRLTKLENISLMKNFIEFLEESRLRPFDLRKLGISKSVLYPKSK